MPVIGYLSLGSPESDTVPVPVVRRGLNEGGYVADQDVTIEYRWAQNQCDRLSALAADLVQHRVAVIVTPGVFSTLAARVEQPSERRTTCLACVGRRVKTTARSAQRQALARKVM
jgi:hypothetical protein